MVRLIESGRQTCLRPYRPHHAADPLLTLGHGSNSSVPLCPNQPQGFRATGRNPTVETLNDAPIPKKTVEGIHVVKRRAVAET